MASIIHVHSDSVVVEIDEEELFNLFLLDELVVHEVDGSVTIRVVNGE